MSETLALFPLGSVLFPGVVLPLHVFEDRYRQLVRDLLDLPEGPARRFGVVAIRAGREVGADGVQAPGALYELGCTAVVSRVEAYDDGRFDLLCVGATRFRVVELDRSRPYLQAHVDILDEPGGAEAQVLAGAAAARWREYRTVLRRGPGAAAADPSQRREEAEQGEGALPSDPGVLSYLVAAAAVLDLTDKQRLLAAPDTPTRLRFELELLRREIAILSVLPSLPAVELPRVGYGRS